MTITITGGIGWRGLARVALMFVCLVASMVRAADDTGVDARRYFDIAPQPLASALIACAEQGGLQILFRAETLGERQSPGIKGSYAPAEAVAILLRNTGLRYEFSGGRTVIVGASVEPAAH